MHIEALNEGGEAQGARKEGVYMARRYAHTSGATSAACLRRWAACSNASRSTKTLSFSVIESPYPDACHEYLRSSAGP